MQLQTTTVTSSCSRALTWSGLVWLKWVMTESGHRHTALRVLTSLRCWTCRQLKMAVTVKMKSHRAVLILGLCSLKRDYTSENHTLQFAHTCWITQADIWREKPAGNETMASHSYKSVDLLPLRSLIQREIHPATIFTHHFIITAAQSRAPWTWIKQKLLLVGRSP